MGTRTKDGKSYKRGWFVVLITIIMVVGMSIGVKTEVLAAVTEAGTYTDEDAGLTYTLYSDMTATVTKYEGSEELTVIAIPETITASVDDVEGSYTVTAISWSVFKECTNLEEIVLPDSLTSIGENAFMGCSSLTSVVIPPKITKINANLFYSCVSLTKVKLPSGLTSIGRSAFYGCDRLEQIDIPTSVTSIGGSAFGSCDLLDDVILPDGLTELGSGAFSYCAVLSCITIPKNVASIGNGTFKECAVLEEVAFQLPSSVASIGERAFYNCTSLQGIELPDNVTSIGINAFSGCTALASVRIPDNVTEILNHAFDGCSMLSELSLPSDLTVIGEDAFNGCSNLNGFLEIPEGATVGYRAFSGTGINKFIVPKGMTGDYVSGNIPFPNYGMVIYPEGERLSFYDYQAAEVTYVEKEDGTVALTLVRNGVTKGIYWTYYEKIPLPASIYGKTISSFKVAEDFSDEYEYPLGVLCTKHLLPAWDTIGLDTHSCICSVCQEEIAENHSFGDGTKACECGYVPFTVTKKSENAALEVGYTQGTTLSVTTKATLGTETITYQWYENDTAIAGATGVSYTVPTGKAAGSYTYYCKIACGDYCIETEETELLVYQPEIIGDIKLVNPEYVTPAPGDCFKDTNNSGIYKVLTVATEGSTELPTIMYVKPVFETNTKVVIPDTVTVGEITYKVTSIDPAAFKGNKKITTVTIGNNVTAIPNNAFKGCTALTTVKMGSSVKNIGKNAFSGCKKLKNVTIGKNVTSIGDKAFYKCIALTKITLPSKVTKIGTSAFEGCTKLKTVTANATKLTKIGEKAFYGCKKLTKLTLKTTKLTKKSIGKNAFKKTNKKLVVKVPKSKVKKYKTYFKNKGNKTITVKK